MTARTGPRGSGGNGGPPGDGSSASVVERPLRVLVNLTWLVPGVVGGSEESTTDALRALVEHRRDVEPILAVHPDFAVAHPDLAADVRCEVIASPFGGGSTTAKATRVIAEQSRLPLLARRLRPDVTHHAGGILPLVHPGPTVLTIHDTQPLDLPENFGAVKRHYIASMLGRSARGAEVVCVPSEFTAGRVCELAGVPRGHVVVVPWSVAQSDQPARTGASAPQAPVFVYPAITYPHKNHLMLLDAFAEVLAALPEARLVLPGGAGACEDEVTRRTSRADLQGRVTRPGRLSQREMELLYDGATAVVVPSSFEGFGLPALEAMVRGIPLLVSSAGSLPEVVDIGGRTATAVDPIDPHDTATWSAAMLSMARLSAEQRRAVVQRQRRAAARFTPERTARTLAGAYHRAAGRPISCVR